VDHSIVREAFASIQDKEALGWAILDSKSETTVTLAIATAANRRAGRRVAHVEYRRVDLVLVGDGIPIALYEAKAAYATDFQPARLARGDWYLGACVDEDLQKKRNLGVGMPTVRDRAVLFYLYEVSDTGKQLKYGRNPPVLVADAINGLKSQITLGTLAAHDSIDCGTVDGAHVKIHLLIFDTPEDTTV
jgi:hypothetical protein